MVSLGSRYWERRLRRWPKAAPTTEGYTLLLPVPGDLPVFLELALAACAAQDGSHRRATIVIPDQDTDAVRRIVSRRRADWPDPLSITCVGRPERWILPRLKSGSRNHGLQLIAGVAATSTRHFVLHDADLFPADPHLLEAQYRTCVERDLSCFGLSGVWDPWYAARGLRLAATWDLVARVDWMRAFRPYDHIGHDAELDGETHTFDTTLLPQTLTDPARIDHGDETQDFVHFNYVISAYRFFQRQGPGYLDDRFLMFFISFMIEVLGVEREGSGLPDPMAMAGVLGRSEGVIRFPDASAVEVYRPFRTKLDRVLASSWIGVTASPSAQSALGAFDEYYGWRAAAA